MLGVTRQRVHVIVQQDDFPEPVATLSGRRVWLLEEVESWARRTGRL